MQLFSRPEGSNLKYILQSLCTNRFNRLTKESQGCNAEVVQKKVNRKRNTPVCCDTLFIA